MSSFARGLMESVLIFCLGIMVAKVVFKVKIGKKEFISSPNLWIWIGIAIFTVLNIILSGSRFNPINLDGGLVGYVNSIPSLPSHTENVINALSHPIILFGSLYCCIRKV